MALLAGESSSSAIGSRIRAVRKSQGLSQDEFGQLLGFSYTVVGNWERGESLPRYPTVAKIYHLFGVTPNFLILGLMTDVPAAKLDSLSSALEESARKQAINKAGKAARDAMRSNLSQKRS